MVSGCSPTTHILKSLSFSPRRRRAERRWAKTLGMRRTTALPAGASALPGASSPFIAKFVQSSSVFVALFEDYPGFRSGSFSMVANIPQK